MATQARRVGGQVRGEVKSKISSATGVSKVTIPDDPGFVSCSAQLALHSGLNMRSSKVQEMLAECDRIMNTLSGVGMYTTSISPENVIHLACVYESFDAFYRAATDEQVGQWFEKMSEISTLRVPSSYSLGRDIEPVMDELRAKYGEHCQFYQLMEGMGFARFSYFQNFSPVKQDGMNDSMVILMRYDQLKEGISVSDDDVRAAMKQIAAETSEEEGCIFCTPMYDYNSNQVCWRVGFADAEAVKLHTANVTHRSDAYSRYHEHCHLKGIDLVGPKDQLAIIREAKIPLCQQAQFYVSTHGWSKI